MERAGNPIPLLLPDQQVTISEIHMVSSHEGWAVGSPERGSDHILRTIDGGASWLDVTPPEPAPEEGQAPRLAASFFLDEATGWAAYTDGPTVWRTVDAGASWAPARTLHPSSFKASLYFSDADHGWLMRTVELGAGHEYVALQRTTNGGASWEPLVDPYTSTDLQSCGKSGVVFAGDQAGWVTYDCGGLYAVPFFDWTVDGGVSWHTVTLPPPPDEPDLFVEALRCGAFSPTLFSPISGALVLRCSRSADLDEQVSYLYTTLDQGLNWRVDPFPGGVMYFLEADFGWALGREIYQTSDGGRTWSAIKTVSWDGQFSFVSHDMGWAVARSPGEIALVKTIDGGRTWELLQPKIVAEQPPRTPPTGTAARPGDIPPTPMGGSGQIAFISYRDSAGSGSSDIYLMNIDGSGVTKITDGSGTINNFAWSPDGKQIVLASDRDGDNEIYVMQADGTGLQQLTDNAIGDDEPAWSPDGEWIAYASQGGIMVIKPDGSAARKLVSLEARTPAWSPDGSKIAFAVWFDGLYVMDADGSNLERLTDSSEAGFEWYPRWSPDGARILFASSRRSPGNALTEEVFIMNADGSGVGYIGDMHWGQPPYAWSPDGTLVAFAHDFFAGATLHLMSADGSDVRPLMDQNEGFHPAWRPLGGG